MDTVRAASVMSAATPGQISRQIALGPILEPREGADRTAPAGRPTPQALLERHVA